ncbi:MAG: hypothetical protein ABIG84_03430 [archaeon]
MERMKSHWIEGLVAGLAAFFVVWILMFLEIEAGLIQIRTPLVEYMFTSLFSAFFMGAVIGLLFAYGEKFILCERCVFRGMVFIALFEMISIMILFFVPSTWNNMMEMYSSIYAFLADVLLTVVLGGYVIGAAYGYLVRRKVIAKLKRPSGLLLIVLFSVFSAAFSVLETALGLVNEFAGVIVLFSFVMVAISAGLYYFKKWGLYAAFGFYLFDVVGISMIAYAGDFSLVPSGIIYLLILCYLFSNKALFNK